jgi:hypothetical protein
MADETNTQIAIDSVTEEFVLLADFLKQRLLGRAGQVDALKRQLVAVMAERDALKPADKPN